jgi:two-component system, OmpR family, alkaline phosphatase synthesis response regulator PhoP
LAKASILVVEDDPDIRELLAVAFAKEGWKLDMAEDGERGLESLEASIPDCVVLDIMLPGMDGLELLRRIKSKPGWKHVPVVMTTARGEDSDIVSGLELGADDYVVKPYSPKVLSARIRTVLRRNAERLEENASADSALSKGLLRLDAGRHETFYGDSPVALSATEFAILEFLLKTPGRVFTRGQIIDAVRGRDYPVTDRSVDVQILSLRKKLGAGGDAIETVRGVGYRLKD